MKTTTLAITCALGILIASCTKEPNTTNKGVYAPKITLSESEFKSIANDNPFDYDENEVIENLSNWLDGFNKDKATTRTVVENLKITDKYYFSTEGNKAEKIATRSLNADLIEPLIYEIEVGDDNLAVVSADSRAPEVLYFGPKLSDLNSENSKITAAFMIGASKMTSLSNIEEVERLKKDLREQTLNKIAQELGIDPEHVDFETVRKQLNVTDGATSRYNNPTGGQQKDDLLNPSVGAAFVGDELGPLLITGWDEFMPYNNQMPEKKYAVTAVNPTGMDNAYPGSGPIAIGQLAALYRPTTIKGKKLDGTLFDIDWNKVNNADGMIYYINSKKCSPADEILNISGLLRSISDECDPTYAISGGNYFKTVHTASSLEKYLKKYFNCSGSFLDVGFSPVNANNSLVVGSPVLVGGKIYTKTATGSETLDTHPHVMLIDGYLIMKVRDNNNYPYVYRNVNYWHVNFGYGFDDGSQPAYFQLGAAVMDNVDVVFAEKETGNLRIMKLNELSMMYRFYRK